MFSLFLSFFFFRFLSLPYSVAVFETFKHVTLYLQQYRAYLNSVRVNERKQIDRVALDVLSNFANIEEKKEKNYRASIYK